ADCLSPFAFFHRRERFALTFFGSPARQNGDPASALETAMRAQGWDAAGAVRYVCPSWSTVCDYHSTPWSHRAAIGSLHSLLGVVRYRYSSTVAAEVMVGTWPGGGSTVGLDSAGTTEIQATWAATRIIGAAVTLERAGFQVGVGPAVQRVR